MHRLLRISLAMLMIFICGSASRADQPNVLFLAVDDLNDWVSCLGGHPDCRTPNIDALADRGVLFTRAYCSAPACNPSRASLMTGVRPSTSGVYLNSQPWRPAMPKAVTLSQYFMINGYRVVGGGKIFHGRYREDTSWHEYFKKAGDPLPPNRPVNGISKTAHFDWGPLAVADEAMDDHRVVDWAISELNKKHDRPLFLACGIFRPHLPWYVPQRFFDLYPVEKITLPMIRDDDLDDVPEAGVRMARPTGDHKKVIDSNNYKNAVQGYLASIAFADYQVGRLLKALDKSHIKDNTIVVFWGDHGWHLGEKHHWRKFTNWEEAGRVPLMIVAPGIGRATCERTVSLLDIYPTLAGLCSLPVPDHVEGKSLLPLLADPSAAWNRPVVTTHGRNNHAIRSERWRYIRYSDGSEELYDHQNDPLEWKNLAARKDFTKVKQQLAEWLPENNVPDAKRDHEKKRLPSFGS